ncbi:P-loop containing nucleoside triphosphate hydrolase protein [Mycena capillaripes]|nr:P-loop containing nucleoside triphosphate hydrolase protein [Mycena capillaripes]
MDRAERERVLATFKKTGGPKVILISTKCGSVGLNLVAANRIINMDLSWNSASESQAYDRAHCIGQNKSVWMKRRVVENTIEERMLGLHDVKVGFSDAALGEGTRGRLHKMSVKDIKQLQLNLSCGITSYGIPCQNPSYGIAPQALPNTPYHCKFLLIWNIGHME